MNKYCPSTEKMAKIVHMLNFIEKTKCVDLLVNIFKENVYFKKSPWGICGKVVQKSTGHI